MSDERMHVESCDDLCCGSTDCERRLSARRMASGHTMCPGCHGLWDRAVAAVKSAHEKECSQLAEVIADTQQLNIAMRSERDQLRARLDEAERLLASIYRTRNGECRFCGSKRVYWNGNIEHSNLCSYGNFLAPPPSAPVHGETGRHAFVSDTDVVENWCARCGQPPGGEHHT